MRAAAPSGGERRPAAPAPAADDDPADLLVRGEALQARRAALEAEIAERARAVADIERERRTQLPELAREERELPRPWRGRATSGTPSCSPARRSRATPAMSTDAGPPRSTPMPAASWPGSGRGSPGSPSRRTSTTR